MILNTNDLKQKFLLSPAPMGDGRVPKQQVRKHWELLLQTCTQIARFYMVSFHENKAVSEIRQPIE